VALRHAIVTSGRAPRTRAARGLPHLLVAEKEQAMARKQGGGMTVAEAGRMGGRLVSEKYGPEFYEKIGKKGGSSTAAKYGPEFFGRIGRKGGKAVTAKYGVDHFERIGRKGGQKVADLIERAKALDADKPAAEKSEVEEREEVATG
jgi:general stress protein YciG